MIERNLGNIERGIRFSIGMLMLGFLLSRPEVSIVEWFVAIVALMLVLNGIFSRCYVWFLFDLNTHKPKNAACDTSA